VRSEVKQSGSSQPVAIDYEMEKDSQRVEGLRRQGRRVSLVTTYRDTSPAKFASTAWTA